MERLGPQSGQVLDRHAKERHEQTRKPQSERHEEAGYLGSGKFNGGRRVKEEKQMIYEAP